MTLLADIFTGGIERSHLDRGWDFLTSDISSFSPETAGVWQGIVGSIVTLVFVIIVAIPLGIGAAVYLEEYAPDTRFSRFINVNIRNLAGVPSIVYGLVGTRDLRGDIRERNRRRDR